MPTVLRRLAPPTVVLVATVWAVRSGLSATISTARWGLALYGVLAIAFLFAWRLRSARAARTAVILGLLGALFARQLGDVATLNHGSLTGLLVPLVVPLDFALIAWLREASLGSRRSALLFGLLGLEVLALWPPVLARLPLRVEDMMPLWPIATLGLGVAFVALRLVLDPTPLSAGWLGVLSAIALAPLSGSPVVWLVAAGLMLLLALVERAFGFAFEDTLTGLPARRALDQRLRELSGRYVIAMADIDHFKRVNDRHGHEVGDQALRWIAAHLRGVRGGGGEVFRYGGEEFALVFPGKTVDEARPHLDALRERVASEPFTLRAPGRPKRRSKATPGPDAKKSRGRAKPSRRTRTLKLTVSIGAAARSDKARTPDQVIEAADRALYRAKRAGRNRTVVARS